MAFIMSGLKKLAGNGDSILWNYRTSDPVTELRESKYWLDALNTVHCDDVIFAVSAAKQPHQVVLLFVDSSFAPNGTISVSMLASSG